MLKHLQHSLGQHTVDYFVSGSANFIDTSMTHMGSIPPGSLKFHWAKSGGFLLANVDDNSLVFTFIEAGGTILHKATIKPRTFV